MSKQKRPATEKQAAATKPAPEVAVSSPGTEKLAPKGTRSRTVRWVPEHPTPPAKARPDATAPAPTRPADPDDPGNDLVVFAFRLTQAEREEIHDAAGPAKASRFVRTVVLAAARRDLGALQAILSGTRREAAG